MATEHRHFYLKTGLMGGWHPIEQKHPLDLTAHDHGDVEVRDAKLTRTSSPRVSAKASADALEQAELIALEAFTKAQDAANALAGKGFSSIEDAIANTPVKASARG